MFIGKAMMIAAAASTAAIAPSWQPVSLGDWQVLPYEETCGMIAPLGRTGSEDILGALTLAPRPDGLLILSVTRAGWTVPGERGTIKIWFDNGYGTFRPIYDQPADFIPEEGMGIVMTLVEPDFFSIASGKSSIDVVVEGPTLGDPQRMTIPLGDLETAAGKLDECLVGG